MIVTRALLEKECPRRKHTARGQKPVCGRDALQGPGVGGVG
jgi:hypothetical protein